MTSREKILSLLIVMAMISLIGLTMAVTGDQPAETAPIPIDEAPAGEKPTQEPAGHQPLMIRWSNWQPEFGPAIVYARENDLDGMLAMDAPVQKMLMVTSYEETNRLMARAAELQVAGVTIVGLNTEGGPGMTPPDELQSINDPNPETNLIARVARLATANGFQVIWGPIRNVTDSTSDAVIRTILSAGVTGLALQEQKFIERQPAQERATAVSQTRQRYLALAAEAGVAHFGIHVQIMHQRCPDLNNCIEFVRLLEAMPVDSIAIWSNGPIPLSFVRAIRRE
ncbi:MAG: hypothetical protein L0332_06565 [Chloroflexi bacterium]|nr:hypothetical protein [Chloroflexota bacterium]MCI0575841.1 hypothetical protein [Chloroflexota bacterium]MCI0646568.1 hypothetical protein [Chloroflexota bacterium]MCI0726370.1 hypothetical protein [Chloroflexota bacterium]